jgi:hypothetical protein
MSATMKRPADLGNDTMYIRTDSDGVLTSAGFRQKADLRSKAGRAVVRRFAQRLLAMCDWWEAR